MAQIDDYPLANGMMPCARMKSPCGRFTKPARGSFNIQTLINQGWTIIPDPINRILPEYRAFCQVEKPHTEAVVLSGATETPKRRGRGPGKKNKGKR